MINNLLERVKKVALEKRYDISKYDEAILKLYQDYLYYKKYSSKFDILSAKANSLEYILSIPDPERFKVINSNDGKYIWDIFPTNGNSTKILDSIIDNSEDCLFVTDTFLRCIVPPAQILTADKKQYQNSVGYMLDDLTTYFDATRPSRIETVINSDLEISDENILRAKRNIEKIIENKISKYNHQPIYTPKIGRDGVAKVLVIDQSYRDFSISKGLADDTTFEKMLNCAIKENPDADIIIKTHPDTIGENSSKPRCYYQNIQNHDNIFRLTEPINPISLIQYADKVYVCSSQFGFEALMCHKEVHTFGMPFYAGWGLTIDEQKCPRRTRTRTLEEIFYIAYIMFSQYLNPNKNAACEIEEAIDYLLEKREQYFNENGTGSES